MQFEDDPRSNRDPAQVKAMLERKALLYDKIKCVSVRTPLDGARQLMRLGAEKARRAA